MNNENLIIGGGKHTDDRGTLYFVNDFDMTQVKRMYMICHNDIYTKRAWRGHRLEKRWFYVVEGGFEITLVKIDQWEVPNPDLKLESFLLNADMPQVLYMPMGYASGFKATVPDSKILVYADADIAHAKDDDYQYPADYFTNWK